MDVSKHLEKAAEAARKKNFEYAIELYHQVLQLKPDHYEARRDLRQVLVRRAEAKKLSPAIGAAQGMFSRLSMVTAGLGKRPDQEALSAEKYLVNDPRNRKVNLQLAEALEKGGHLHGAVAVLEFMGEDEEIGDYALKKAGSLYYQLKKHPQALACYEAVLKRNPRDSEAEKARKNLAAEGVLSSGSYDPTRSSRELARDKDKARQLELDQRVVVSTDQRQVRIDALEKTLAAAPADKRARRELTELFARGKEYDRAAAVLEEGLVHDPASGDLKDRLGEIRLLAFEQQIREAESKAAAGDAAAATDVVDLRRERSDFELEEVLRRVGEHPTDFALRHRLGQLLLEADRVDEAIENFQQAVKDPRKRVDALLGLGAAFQRKGLDDLARKQVENALESVEPESERATDISYELGVLLERTGDAEGALARFAAIYERNIQYRDVAQRVARLRARRAPAAPARAPEPPPRAESPASSPPPATPERPAPAELQKPTSAESQKPAPAEGGSIYDFKD